jgi:hypothetical protein
VRRRAAAGTRRGHRAEFKRGDGRDTIVHRNAHLWPCRLHVDQQPLHVERAAAAPAGAGTKCRAAAIVGRSGSGRAAWPDDAGGERGCFADRRCRARRAARVHKPVLQDQLLAESEAAVPAEMVREFQVAGLRTGLSGNRPQQTPLIPARQHRVYPMLAVLRAQVGCSRLAMGIQILFLRR